MLDVKFILFYSILLCFTLFIKPHVSTDNMVLRSYMLLSKIYLLVLSSWMENRILSQMCGRLCLPIFLLRVGLLTLIYMAYLLALANVMPLPAYYLEVVHCCYLASSVLVFKYC